MVVTIGLWILKWLMDIRTTLATYAERVDRLSDRVRRLENASDRETGKSVIIQLAPRRRIDGERD